MWGVDMKNLNKKAFTLVEVLVASVIVGLIVLALVGLWRASFGFMRSGGEETILQNRTAAAKFLIHKDLTEASWATVPVNPGEGANFFVIGASNVNVKNNTSYGKVINSNDIQQFIYCINGTSDKLYRYYRSSSNFSSTVSLACGSSLSGWSYKQVLTELSTDECIITADSDFNAIRIILVTEKIFASDGKVVRTEIDEKFRVLGSPTF